MQLVGNGGPQLQNDPIDAEAFKIKMQNALEKKHLETLVG